MILAAATMLFALMVVTLRYWIFPNIDRYQGKIIASMSSTIGRAITIGRIQGDWQGLLPRLDFSDIHILDEKNQPALILKRVQGSLSWMSLLTAQLRLASLDIESPELLIRRDMSGNMFIGGLMMGKTGEATNNADWLLRQSRIVVHDAIIVWVDQLRDAPPLTLKKVDVRLESLFNRHRFAFLAVPPAGLASPLDIRGDFVGDSFSHIGSWSGTLFTRCDHADVSSLRAWVDLPKGVGQASGALRSWIYVHGGEISGVTADLALNDVLLKLSENLPEMALTTLHGRAAWQKMEHGFEVSTQGLALRMKDGTTILPTDFYWRYEKDPNGQSSAEMRANQLHLDSLNRMSLYLPVGDDLRAQLDEYAPKGTVSNLELKWHGPSGKPAGYTIRGNFDGLALKQVGEMPGFSGLTFNIDGNEVSGRLNVNSRKVIVNAPGVIREPLSFSTISAQAGWKRESGELKINVDNLAVANDDLAGTFFGSYQTSAGSSGMLDLTGRLTRGDISRAARYTPLIALDKQGSDWLNGALLAGHTEDFRIRIKGSLDKFPPEGSKGGLFELSGHARDAVLEFDKKWPRIEKITGEFKIQGKHMDISAPSAVMAGAGLHKVLVAMPDITSKDLILDIHGEAQAASDDFLDFIQKSPVRGYIDGFTDGMRASGNANLKLALTIPLQGQKPVRVSGGVNIQNNDVDLGKDVPLLRKTSGVLSFTESGLSASGITTEIFGGVAGINIQTDEHGAVHAAIKGRSNVGVLGKQYQNPILDYLHGSAAWDADVTVNKKAARYVINSNLQGLSSSLPEPFRKGVDEPMMLHLERNPVVVVAKNARELKSCTPPCPEPDTSVIDGQDVISVRLGNILAGHVSRAMENGVMRIKHGVIKFGADQKIIASPRTQQRLENKEGVHLIGSLPIFSFQGWNALMGSSRQFGMDFPIAGIDLKIENLTGYGQNLGPIRINGHRIGDGLAVQLSSDQVEGEVIWEPHGYDAGGLLRTRLKYLHWNGAGAGARELTQAASAVPPVNPVPGGTGLGPQQARSSTNPGNLPAFDARVEDLDYKGMNIGHIEFVGQPEGNDWVLRRLNIANLDGSLVGDGGWKTKTGEGSQTQLNLVLSISDAGKVLARYGYPNTVKGGNGKLSASLSWPGAPADFSLSIINGTLNLDAAKGRFLKMDPGAGKLLGVLSLQELPRNIALGFKDVFSEGFEFNSMVGNASIKDGVIRTEDFRIDGSSAKVVLKGSVDLDRETQDIRVRVLPTLGESVSMIGLIAISPAVGIGSLIANKILDNPLDKLVSFEYNVSGTWGNPKVVKLGGPKVIQKNQSEQELK
jgi:uncharacterized protein (TIGR02099 family)